MTTASALTVADLLVQIGAVEVRTNPQFTLKSGKLSPIYCDNRLFLSRPIERKAMLDHMYEAIRQKLRDDEWDGVAGVATSGIPFAAWVAMEFNKPMVYVRSAEKDHGKLRRVEGGMAAHERVILIEDHITTGGSSLDALSALRSEGLVCEYCFSILNYRFDSTIARFEQASVKQTTLADFEDVVVSLRNSGAANQSQIEELRAWYRSQNN